MSDASTQFSKPSARERRLLSLAAEHWEGHPAAWVDEVLVSPMSDGNMGSLRLRFPNARVERQRFGRQVAEFSFTDADGVEVLVSLNVDEHGVPFELDVWKTDFSPLLNVPE
jgi:hypothetical protein